jgi:pyruvate dehydrogenase kinase 2/3/4
MQQYLDFGRTGSDQSSYQFLKTELLVRMANIMQEFDLLPNKLLQMPSARHVASWYKQSAFLFGFSSPIPLLQASAS